MLFAGNSSTSMELYHAALVQKDGEIAQLQATVDLLNSQKSALRLACFGRLFT
jgi:hypothetical protein